MKRLALALFLVLPALAYGQSWPVFENTYVNDYANVIDEDAETRIRRNLEVLREETGIEATVLTIYTRWGFQSSGSLETFATGLFNHWGIGDADRNDGILVLVVSEDREMRIELGAGYPKGFNREAQDIIDRVFLPAFKAGNMSNGIEDGTDATLKRIARAHAAGEAPPASSGSGTGWGLFAFFGAMLAGFIGLFAFGRRIRDRFSRCPGCGRRGIHTHTKVLDAATKTRKGRGEKTVTCNYCDYHHTSTYSISRVSSSSSSSGGSFGGGSSSGGGASGRW